MKKIWNAGVPSSSIPAVKDQLRKLTGYGYVLPATLHEALEKTEVLRRKTGCFVLIEFAVWFYK